MRLAFVLRGGLQPSGRVEIIPAYLGLPSGLAATAARASA